ncbi:MAG: PQQ-dependent sugar dehydrogenase [Bacteroidota bacterium]|nr:PQQ-dependent sugar dehydrogenase [Bacteroidota bacterium]
MRILKFVFPIIAILLVAGFTIIHKKESISIKVKIIVEGLLGPVAMDCPKDGSGRLFVCEQNGKIKIIKNKKVNTVPFLELGSKVDKGNMFYSEKGLLGIAFHPDYKVNGRFFIYYSAPSKVKGSEHKSILAEYKVSSNPDIANAGSEKILMEIEQPQMNHNGGQLAFGPDGYLYIGLGDGGGAGDEHGTIGNGQDLNTLLGKILRINIDNYSVQANSQKKYSIPADNPFIKNKNVRPEIWAYGLRNPWRFSFDRKTGALFCADVGQDKWEEIDLIEKGKNYGWRLMEGRHCYEPEINCNQRGLTLPIAEYGHQTGICVTGGYVYRGNSIKHLQGKYIFGDWKGKLFYLEEKTKAWEMKDLILTERNDNDLGFNINSFGEDEKGEVYILAQKFTGTVQANGMLMIILDK